jgi:hypothetical protein
MPTNNYNKSKKEANASRSTVRIVKQNVISHFYARDTTALEVVNNYHIKSVEDCPNLSIVSLVRTRVENIDNCPLLYSLIVINNSRLVRLAIPSAQDVSLEKIPTLANIRLANATKVSLDNLPALCQLSLTHVINLSISNMVFNADIGLISSEFPHLKTLQLSNVDNFPLIGEGYSRPLKKLYIRNCNIERLARLDGYGSITIEQCNQLVFVDRISNTSTLNIDNCPNLVRVQYITATDEINIIRCSGLQRVVHVEASTISIEYCFSIVSLPSLFVQNIKVCYCPSFSAIKISDSLRGLVIQYCDMFEFVEFNSVEINAHEDIKITIEGSNRIEYIKDWYASELTISDNSSLESIANVYNLANLSLTDCRELGDISNMFISESMTVNNCAALESITNVCGVQTAIITECESLRVLQIYLSEISKFAISHCHELHTVIDGSHLRDLILIECGSVLVTNIELCARVDTINAISMPDISSDLCDDDISDTQEQDGARRIQTRMYNLQTATNIIARSIGRYLKHIKKAKYQDKELREGIHACVICLEMVESWNVSFTSCDHMFHSKCIHQWLQVRRQCPLCNTAIP